MVPASGEGTLAVLQHGRTEECVRVEGGACRRGSEKLQTHL